MKGIQSGKLKWFFPVQKTYYNALKKTPLKYPKHDLFYRNVSLEQLFPKSYFALWQIGKQKYSSGQFEQ